MENMEIEEEKQEIGNLFIEAINNLTAWEKIKLFFICIGDIIINFFRLIKHKIKELFKRV